MKTAIIVSSADIVEELARSHGQSLVTYAFLLCGDRDEAQDLTQSVFSKLLRLDLLEVADPLAYARRAITNEFLERKRRQVRWLRYVRLSRVEPHHIESPEGGLAERDALLRAFAVLSARERTAVVLRYYEGWEDAAIAGAVGCTRGTVRSLLSRAMAKLRRSMSEDGPAEQGGRS